MRQKTPLHSLLSCLLTVAILTITGVLGCHHSFIDPAGRAAVEVRPRTGPTLAPDTAAPLLGSDPHCALCATQRLLNQSRAEEIHALPAPGRDSALVACESTHPTVPGVRLVDARSPPLS